jgi:hypothetical protein
MYKPVRTRSGAIIQAGLDARVAGEQSRFAPRHNIYRAIVVNTYTSDNSNNRRGFEVECDVILVGSQTPLTAVPVLQRNHGVNNVHALWIPRPTTRAISGGDLNLGVFSRRGTFNGPATAYNDMDGDMVALEFVEGRVDFPVITGALTHEQTRRKVIIGGGWSEGGGADERGTPQADEFYTHHYGTEVRINSGGDVLIDTIKAHSDIVEEDSSTGGGQVRVRVKDTEKFVAEVDGDINIKTEAALSLVANPTRVELGDAGASQALVKGTYYRAQETLMNGSLQTALTAAAGGLTAASIDPILLAIAPVAAAGLAAAAAGLTSAVTAISTFEVNSATPPTYLSTKVFTS